MARPSLAAGAFAPATLRFYSRHAEDRSRRRRRAGHFAFGQTTTSGFVAFRSAKAATFAERKATLIDSSILRAGHFSGRPCLTRRICPGRPSVARLNLLAPLFLLALLRVSCRRRSRNRSGNCWPARSSSRPCRWPKCSGSARRGCRTPAAATAAQWTAAAERLRAAVLEQVVLRGEAARWQKLPTARPMAGHDRRRPGLPHPEAPLRGLAGDVDPGPAL